MAALNGFFAGVHGLTADRRDRLRAALGPADLTPAHGPFGIGWAQPAVGATVGAITCVVAGRVDDNATLQEELGAEGQAAALARGYERWGPALLDRIRGQFTLVVWNRETREGLLAVDQLGSGALFFSGRDGTLSFASEIRDLLRLLPQAPEPDPRFLSHYIGGEPGPEDLTPFAGMRRLPGGHLILLGGESWRVERYWSPRYAEPLRLRRPELVEAVREQVKRSVEKRTEVGRTGILLSGGLDSTSIAALAPPGPDRFRAYSAVFPSHGQSDESGLLADVTAELQLPWTRAIVRRATMLHHSIAYLREWQVPSAVPNLYFTRALLEAAVAEGASVVLDGEGGDELFACVGYAAADRLRHGDAAGAVRLIRNLPWDGGEQPWRATYHLLKQFGKGVVPHGVHAGSRRLRRASLGGAPWLSLEARSRVAATADPWAWKRADGPRWWAFLSDMLTAGRVRFGVHDVLRRVGHMAGVDRRHPYLDDLDLIELVLAIPPEASFDARHSRPLIREAVDGMLPDSVRLGTSKADFRFLVEDCYRGPERAAISSLVLDPDTRIRPYIAQAVLEDAVARVGQPGLAVYQSALTRTVTAELWLRSLEDPHFLERFLETWPLPTDDIEIVPFSGSTRRSG